MYMRAALDRGSAPRGVWYEESIRWLQGIKQGAASVPDLMLANLNPKNRKANGRRMLGVAARWSMRRGFG